MQPKKKYDRFSTTKRILSGKKELNNRKMYSRKRTMYLDDLDYTNGKNWKGYQVGNGTEKTL